MTLLFLIYFFLFVRFLPSSLCELKKWAQKIVNHYWSARCVSHSPPHCVPLHPQNFLSCSWSSKINVLWKPIKRHLYPLHLETSSELKSIFSLLVQVILRLTTFTCSLTPKDCLFIFQNVSGSKQILLQLAQQFYQLLLSQYLFLSFPRLLMYNQLLSHIGFAHNLFISRFTDLY